MESSKSEDIIKNISKLILTNQQKMIREEDLRNLSENFDFDQIINEVYINLINIGFELIKTKFLWLTWDLGQHTRFTSFHL